MATSQEATPPGGPKDRNNITQESRVIYRYKCDRLECDEEYIEGVCKDLWEKAQRKSPSLSTLHGLANTKSHHTRVDNFSIVSREVCNITRTIKEAMYIMVNDPPLIWNIHRFQLSHIWDDVLFNNPPLHLK